jgi:hypothetical protein
VKSLEEAHKAKTRCGANLKQIGFAIFSYERANGRVLPASVYESEGIGGVDSSVVGANVV